MKTLILVFLVAFCAAHAGSAAEWRFGTTSMQWFDGYERTPNGDAHRFVGPQGEIVLVSVMGIREGADGGSAAKWGFAFGEKELPKLSAAKGRDVMKLRREELDGGTTLFSTAAVPKKNKKMFYLQFFAVSKSGRSALLTVEGVGEPAEQLKRFRPLLDTLDWGANEKEG